MDIYSFLNSPDIADHCRNIGHVFNSLEMAIIIAISEKTVKEKHSAWREIITDYPDMPIPDSNCFDARESLHGYLCEFISWEERAIADFSTPGTDVIYRCVYERYSPDNVCYRTIGEALAAFNEDRDWKEDGIEKVEIIREVIGSNQYQGSAYYNSSSELLDIFYRDKCLDNLSEIFFHLPIPFKKGDILECFDTVFVLDTIPHWDDGRGKKYEDYLTGKFNDRSDMIGWGLFVSDNGILYGDHTGNYDYYEYYCGKLEGENRLLHYVSLYIKGEHGFHLPELLTMQGRIMLEHLLDKGLLIKSHGCCISERLLAENRLTDEEKEQVKQGNSLAPWVADKLNMDQVEFLAKEAGTDVGSVQFELCDGGGWHLGRCARIVHQENHYERINDNRFNADRRAMARLILERYGHTEDDWTDNYVDNPDYQEDGTPPMPDYTKLNSDR